MNTHHERQSAPTGATEPENQEGADRPLGDAACSLSPFWVLDGDCISSLKPPAGIPRSNWMAKSVANAWNAIPEEFRPRAVILSFQKRCAQSGGSLWPLMDLFDIEGIPTIAFPIGVRSLDPYINRVAKQDPVLLDDVVRHLDDLVSVTRVGWVRRQVPSVNELPTGKLQKGGI